MSCDNQNEILTLNAKQLNKVLYSLNIDTTGYDVIFRFKKNIENTTTPIEATTTKITEGATSNGYFILDLTANTITGSCFYEIELNDGINPPLFYADKPEPAFIQTRLKN